MTSNYNEIYGKNDFTKISQNLVTI